MLDTNDNYIKILRVALEIENFYPDYDFIFNLCSQRYEDYPEKYVHLMEENLEKLWSKRFLRFLLRKYKTLKPSFNLIQRVPRSNDNVKIILEILDVFLGGHDRVISEVSTEIISILETFTETEFSTDFTIKLLNVHSKFHKVTNNKVIVNALVIDKPWRNFKVPLVTRFSCIPEII